MRNPEFSERRRRRIRESFREYTPKEQKAELLLRNTEFLIEKDKTIGSNIVLPAREGSSVGGGLQLGDNWLAFNYRWRLDGWWDGSDVNLWKHVILGPEIYYRDPKSGIVWIDNRRPKSDACDQRSIKGSLNISEEGPFIFVRIDPWTHTDDLRNVEGALVKLSKRVFGYAERELRNYSRDLCWFDLKKKSEYGRPSYSDIGNLWKKHNQRGCTAPHKNTVVSAVQRIQSLIDRMTPNYSACLP